MFPLRPDAPLMKCLAVQPRLVPLFSLLFTCIAWTCGSICAQPPATAPTAPPLAESDDLIRESDLKYHLLDKNGTLVHVPGFTLKRYLELRDLEISLNRQQGALPTAVFGPIDLEGSVDPDTHLARLQVTFRIKLPSREGATEASWSAIPLQLDGAFLDDGEIGHDEEGEIHVSHEKSGYVCWLLAAPGSTHTIRVPIKVPVRRTGSQDALSIILPDMAATMRLTVTEEMIEALIPSGLGNVSWVTRASTTVITVDSGGGKLDVAWRKRGEDSPHALEATCETTVHVHGNHIWSEAQLKVRSRVGPIDSFVVRLPEGMELTPRNEPDFQISTLPSTNDHGSQRVLVKRLAGPTRGQIEAHLEAAVPKITVETQRRIVQLAGFSVEDSVREWGSVDVILDGNWSPAWGVGEFVQRVAVPEDLARQQPVAARFLYERQPYELRLELNPKLTRVAFDTTYVVDVSEDQIQLDARIAYSTNDAKVDSLSFKMPGWTIDTVTPQESLAKPFSVDSKGVLTLPIAAGTTELDFRIQARRPVEKSATDISFDLPRPTDLELRPKDLELLPNATLIVLAGDNVELTPELASMKWLNQETRTPTVELPQRFSAPLVFREELSTESNEAAHFVARRRIRPRELSVAVTSDAMLEADIVQVRQSFVATVAYAPLAELTIAVPPSVAAAGTLRITSGEQQLKFREATTAEPLPPAEAAAPAADPKSPAVAPMAAEPAAPAATQAKIHTVSLPKPVTGGVQVEITFEIPRKDVLDPDGLRIPLVQPAGDEATDSVTNLLTVRSDDNTAVTLADELWTTQPDAVSPSNGKSELRVRSMGVVEAALVQTATLESRTSGSTSISRVWIQSLLEPTSRLDRVCFQLLSDRPLVHVELPETVRIGRLHVLVDSKSPIELVDDGDHSLTITLADEQVGRVIALELLYLSQATGDSRFRVAIPSIIGADHAERVYWQLALPRDEHLAWMPAELTSELVWQRDEWYWGRRGRLEQPALEELVGASTRDPVSSNTNRYLFSSTGSVNSVDFVKVSRLMLMFVASGSVLALVLPFIYLPTLRRPAVFFVVGVVMFAATMTYPDYSALLGQAGAIGVGLAVVACALQRLVGRSSPVMPVIRRSSVYTPSDSQSAGTSVRVSEGSSRATTATAPAHLQAAQVEGDS